MTPTLFGESVAPLFGVLHEPQTQPGNRTRDHGVLLCSPIAQEYVRSHWAMRQLAVSLSRAGFACLRFDWSGVGDSSGTLREASTARWRADAAAAAQELKDSSGVRRISIVGLRFGAAIALAAASQIKPASLVLWDLVTDGRAYVAELRGLTRSLLDDPKRYWSPISGRQRPATELVGFDLGETLIEDIESSCSLDPAPELRLPNARVCLLDSNGSPTSASANAALEQCLRDAGAREVERKTANLAACWADPSQVEEVLLPADAVRCVTEYLEASA